MNSITRKTNKVLRLPQKAWRYLQNNGLPATLLRIRQKLKEPLQYKKLRELCHVPQNILDKQRQFIFPQNITFSIIVPLYNTPDAFLREMIDSVQAQTYENWELCLADGSDGQHPQVGQICREYAAADKRIKYQQLTENLGISGNTNACLDMSTGDYIALFDHDDLLHPCALFEMMKAICEQNADYIFTDEIVFTETVDNIIATHFKPDFGPDTLLANNYICHFSAFSREVYEAAGAFRSAYDGSQDHDFILRATHHAKNIVHIPKVLYLWRSHPNSVASDIAAKPYAVTAGIGAVKDYLASKGIDAKVESTTVFPAMYRITYPIENTPLVSIVIPSGTQCAALSWCITAVLTKTSYPNYEIVVVDSGSTEPKLLNYYNLLTEKYGDKIRIIRSNTQHCYAGANNLGAEKCLGEYIVFLDRSMEVLSANWLEEMLMYAQRQDVGLVGAKVFGKHGNVQHAWVIPGMGPEKIAGYAFSDMPAEGIGYMGKLWYAQNCSAVSSDCVILRKDVWHQVGGFCTDYSEPLCGIDLSFKVRMAGYLIVWNPYAQLRSHHRRYFDLPRSQKKWKPMEAEVKKFRSTWQDILTKDDPYYNSHFSLSGTSYTLDMNRQVPTNTRSKI